MWCMWPCRCATVQMWYVRRGRQNQNIGLSTGDSMCFWTSDYRKYKRTDKQAFLDFIGNFFFFRSQIISPLAGCFHFDFGDGSASNFQFNVFTYLSACVKCRYYKTSSRTAVEVQSYRKQPLPYSRLPLAHHVARNIVHTTKLYSYQNKQPPKCLTWKFCRNDRWDARTVGNSYWVNIAGALTIGSNVRSIHWETK